MKNLLLSLALALLASFNSLIAQNPRNLLLDDVTATGCSHCACMDSVINRIVLNQHPNTVVLGIQGPSSMFYLPQFEQLFTEMAFQSTGTLVNRQGKEIPVDDMVDSVNARYVAAGQSPVKIRIVSKFYNAVTRMIDVSVELTSVVADLPGTYRINLAVVENNLMGPQQHDPGCPGGDPYPDKFIPHYNVLRKLVLPVLGEEFISGTWTKDQTISKSYSFKLDSTDWAAENCDMVVYVDKKADSLFRSEIQQAVRQSVTRPLGIDTHENSVASVTAVYPNPSAGLATLRINVKNAGRIRVSLVNASGAVVAVPADQVFGSGSHDIQLNNTGLPPGLYSLVLEERNEKSIYKLIIR